VPVNFILVIQHPRCSPRLRRCSFRFSTTGSANWHRCVPFRRFYRTSALCSTCRMSKSTALIRSFLWKSKGSCMFGYRPMRRFSLASLPVHFLATSNMRVSLKNLLAFNQRYQYATSESLS
jgi:hypothetical protein